ncbi:MAG: hypothetical protein AB7O65_10115, partial [Candidatus Korobacteraceae bacterium]
MQRLRGNTLLLAMALLVLLAACGRSSEEAPMAEATPEGATESAPAADEAAPAPQLKTRTQAAAPKPAAPVVLPEGTTLRVRLDHAVGSKISKAGDPFTASVAEPVAADGKVVIPAGSEVSGVVTNAKAQGRLAG